MKTYNVNNHFSSARLFYRTLDTTDASILQKFLAFNKASMIPWIPWAINEPETIEKKKEKIQFWIEEQKAGRQFTYGIFDPKGAKLIGLGFLFTRQGPGILEIGYIIDRNHVGVGYGTELSYALTKMGFLHFKIPKIHIICNKANIPSAKIPKKLGYQIVEQRMNEKFPDSNDIVWEMEVNSFETNNSWEPVNF